MSTVAVTNEDYKFFDFLAPYVWPTYTAEQIQLLRDQVDSGILQIETMLENALAQASQGTYTRQAKIMDFSDNSDAKKSISRRSGGRIKMGVKKIKNKEGLLRVLAYSKPIDQFFFYAFPSKVFKGMTEITVDCGLHGVPQGSWSRFRVGTFEELATITDHGATIKFSNVVEEILLNPRRRLKSQAQAPKKLVDGQLELPL